MKMNRKTAAVVLFVTFLIFPAISFSSVAREMVSESSQKDRRNVPELAAVAVTASKGLPYCSYLGGSGSDTGSGMAIDSSGNVLVIGNTGSGDFPTVNAYQETLDGEQDIFISKFSPDGQLLFSSFLGGSGNDWGIDIGVDAADNIWITGFTDSSDFPTVNPYQTDHGGGEDAYIAKLSSDGQSLLYSSFLGGSDNDRGWRLGIDGSGNVVVAGYSNSTDFPTVNAHQETHGGGLDSIVFKFSSDGQSLVFSTYNGSSGDDWAHDIAIDASGNIVVVSTGHVSGSSFQAIVTKFDSGGNLLFSVDIGGSGLDYGHGVDLDSTGNIVFTGSTGSILALVNASQSSYGGGGSDAFVAKLSPDGQTTIFSTYLGGGGTDACFGIDIGAYDNIVVTGETASSDFPTENAVQETYGGNSDVFVTGFNADGQRIFSTYLGGDGHDWGTFLVANTAESIYLVGSTASSNISVQNAYQSNPGGGFDCLICEFSFDSNGAVDSSTGFGAQVVVLGLTAMALLMVKKGRKRK